MDRRLEFCHRARNQRNHCKFTEKWSELIIVLFFQFSCLQAPKKSLIFRTNTLRAKGAIKTDPGNLISSQELCPVLTFRFSLELCGVPLGFNVRETRFHHLRPSPSKGLIFVLPLYLMLLKAKVCSISHQDFPTILIFNLVVIYSNKWLGPGDHLSYGYGQVELRIATLN